MVGDLIATAPAQHGEARRGLSAWNICRGYVVIYKCDCRIMFTRDMYLPIPCVSHPRLLRHGKAQMRKNSFFHLRIRLLVRMCTAYVEISTARYGDPIPPLHQVSGSILPHQRSPPTNTTNIILIVLDFTITSRSHGTTLNVRYRYCPCCNVSTIPHESLLRCRKTLLFEAQ